MTAQDNTPEPNEAPDNQPSEQQKDKAAEIMQGLQEQDPLAPEMYPEYDEADNVSQDGNKIMALETELDQARDKMMRVAAEAENTRKRAARERDDAAKFAVSGFAKDLLEVSDNLRRALDAMPEDLIESDPRLKNLTNGIEVTEKSLLKTFEKHGIEKIEPLDEPFNPNFHEVMFEAPIPGKAAGIIMQVIEPGYILNGRLLRAAKVGITSDSGSAPDANHPGGNIDTSA